ncbi:MAG TPA: HDIG domain-containing protein, partial [Polyangia bacterium]|nr:HDIG domain-containing protein [Polyangia bacterium]
GLARSEQELAQRRERLNQERAKERERSNEIRRLSDEAAQSAKQRFAVLERRAEEAASSLRQGIIDTEAEGARTAAAHLLRNVEQSVADPEHGRMAKRIMGIAVGRFSGHYLTERLHSIIPVPVGINLEQIAGADEVNLRTIEQAANIRLLVTEGKDALRLEGLDGVGREVARRTVTWMGRHAGAIGDPAAVGKAAKDIAHTLDRELMDLGKRAFSNLEIPLAHPEIVALVGRLNYRTSFTQNQWKHAVEAAFLCGMMANELGLDLKLARRAALMHDIGKALTHEMDGSHAVIGADYARRLGESETVANAIGAHHTDEPFSSPYAYLVAAADAMSGARPGARRQMEDNYVARLDDLERITRSFRGVEEAYAVQGGREVRIYVAEDKVDDRAAIGLSSEIAKKISEEMTFPGQIRVTVIRELRAVEVAN